jgi:phosphoglycerate dehydrogenase-like enzyme
MKILFIPFSTILHPWYDDFVTALGGQHSVELYDATKPVADQFHGVGVVVDQGGWGTRQMIDAAHSAGVKLWQILGTGLDHVDVAYYLQKGMPLANTPGPFSAIGLAEHALFLMLFFVKNFYAGQHSLKSQVICDPLNDELYGKTVGLVGLGASGRALAKRAAAMGMRTMAIDAIDVPQAVREELRLDFFGDPSQLDRILSEADFISLHVPLTSKTRHLIDRRALSLMKPTAVLINVARGEIVDEAALIEALQAHRIRGAGLDVFAHEPLEPSHPFLQFDNVVATPHVAGVTTGTSRRRGQACAENVSRIAQGLPPLYRVTSAE